jgi:glycosyltransferase involved in cell wall biosynthesis
MSTAVRTNLLFITTYTGVGGGESLQLNLIRVLDRNKYNIHLLTPRSGAFPHTAAQYEVSTHVMPFRGPSTLFVPEMSRNGAVVSRFKSFLQEYAIDVILSDYHSLPFIVPAAKSLNLPVIWNAINWWYPIYPWQRHFFESGIDKIITITGAVKERLLRNLPAISPEKIEVLIPGVDPNTYHPYVDGSPIREKIGIAPDVPLVAMVARFEAVKGHEYFLEAARHILDAIPEAYFAIAGENIFAVSKDALYKRQILLTVKYDPRLRARVTFLGFWPDVREVIAAADVMVISSWYESLSMVALESMSMQRAIVSTSVGGPAETVVDGVTGYLVTPRDGKAIADRVVELLHDPLRRQQLGEAGRNHVIANFSAQKYAASVSAVLDQLTAKHSIISR